MSSSLCLGSHYGDQTRAGTNTALGINRWDRDNKYSEFFRFLHILWEFILNCVVAVWWGSSAYWPECLQLYLTTPAMPEVNYDGKPSLYKASLAIASLSPICLPFSLIPHLERFHTSTLMGYGKKLLRMAKCTWEFLKDFAQLLVSQGSIVILW